MLKANLTILLVDDDPLNLTILEEYMNLHGLCYVSVSNGEAALAALAENPEINLILLDRMMPGISGIEVTKRIKEHPKWAKIPVIMQTAANASEQIQQGLEAGVFYYLVKPYEEQALMAIIQAACASLFADDFAEKKVETEQHYGMHFSFRAVEEVPPILSHIAAYVPCEEAVLIGLQELMLNAVEHGNLAISYAEKRDWMAAGMFEKKMRERMADAVLGRRLAELYLVRNGDSVRVTISDEGAGFDPAPYFAFAPERLTDPNGRGIAISAAAGFDLLEYQGCGNEVICRFQVKAVGAEASNDEAAA